MLEGLYIGLTGTFAGLVLGIAIAANINLLADAIAWMLGLPALDPTIYYFDRIPAVIVWSDVAWITGAAVALTFISTLYPAWSAARVDPVDALRNE
jgi:lipoprotein-releasing system permease protein